MINLKIEFYGLLKMLNCFIEKKDKRTEEVTGIISNSETNELDNIKKINRYFNEIKKFISFVEDDMNINFLNKELLQIIRFNDCKGHIIFINLETNKKVIDLRIREDWDIQKIAVSYESYNEEGRLIYDNNGLSIISEDEKLFWNLYFNTIYICSNKNSDNRIKFCIDENIIYRIDNWDDNIKNLRDTINNIEWFEENIEIIDPYDNCILIKIDFFDN